MKKTHRILSVVLVLLMLFSVSMVATSAYTVPDGYAIADTEGNDETGINGEVFGLIGDSDMNDTVNVRDATLIQKYAASLVVLDEIQLVLSDVNFDGNVNVKDATPIQKWVAGIETLEPINTLIYAPAGENPTEPEDEPTTGAQDEPTTGAQDEPTTGAQDEPTTGAQDEPTTGAQDEPTTGAADDGMVTIYFSNNGFWDTVYIYGFYGVEGGDTTGIWPGDYPGAEMTLVETNDYGQEVYSYDVPADIDYIKFSDGSDANRRTNNVPSSMIAENAGFYLGDSVGTNKWDVGTYTYVPSTPDTTPEETTPADSTQDEATGDESETTDPVEDTTAAPELVASDYAIRGTFTDWGSNDAINYVAGSDSVISATYELAAGSYEFKIYNMSTEKWYGNGSSFEDACDNWGFREDRGDATLIATGGTYTFTVDVSDTSRLGVTVTKADDSVETDPVETDPVETDPVETDPVETDPAETDPVETDPVESEPALVASKYSIRADFNNWDDSMVLYGEEGATVVTATITLEAGTYGFKILDTDGNWYGNPGTINDDTAGNAWVFRTANSNNCTLVATGGTYLFSLNISSSNPRLTVSYTASEEEETTAPEDTTSPEETVGYTVYFINSSNWAEVCAYAWTNGGEITWPGIAMTKTDETVNGFDVYSVTFDTEYSNVVFNNNNNGSQTGDLTLEVGKYYDVKSLTWYDSLEDVPEVSTYATNRYLAGSFNGWSTTANEFVLLAEGDTVGYIELELEANTTYEFKIVREGTWTSCKETLSITDSVSGLTFSSSVQGNTTITTQAAGTYVFAFGMDNSQLSVTYPE